MRPVLSCIDVFQFAWSQLVKGHIKSNNKVKVQVGQ